MGLGSTLSELVKNSIKAVSGRRVKEFAHEISKFHRIQASPGYHEALEFVRGVLDGLDIETEVFTYPADGETLYGGGWPAPIGWIVRDAELWMKEPREELISTFVDHPTMVIAHCRPTDGWEEAEVADAGSGVLDEEYPEDVEGKLVLATGRVGWVHRMVIKRGAKGLIYYSETAPADAYPYTGLWPLRREIEGLGVAFSISRRWANKLKSELRSSKVVLKYRVDSEFFDGSLEVLEARIPGESDNDVLLIGHLCHPKPGGHDNASGSACLMEIAIALKKLVEEGAIKPKFGFRLWWVPEFYGTIAHLSAHRDLLDKLVALLNLDMVGASQERTGGHLAVIGFPFFSPSFMPLVTFGVLERVMASLSPRGLKLFMEKYADGSDHHVFADPKVGVPQTAIGEWVDRFYHTDMDFADNLDLTALSIVSSASVATAALLSTSSSSKASSKFLIKYTSIMALRHGFREISSLLSDKSQFSSSRAWTLPEAYKIAITSLETVLESEYEELERAAEEGFSKLIDEVRGSGIPRPESKKKTGIIYSRRRACPLHRRMFIMALPKERAVSYLLKGNLANIADTLYYALDGKRDLSDAWMLVSSEIEECTWEEFLAVARDLEKAGWIAKS
ncbi:MAG: hypothetical protein DRO05_01940 [Thermoproteota archaeon]|nr:MAG: hypothetical protein DRO05_01940 [Candidatus Korarchaeota archaeon]